MNNQLMTFSSEELNFSISGVLYQDKPAFNAVELAKSLGYADPHDALKKHCKSLIKVNSGDSQESGFGFRPKGITLAGQADLFRLILRSQLPFAERVQDWVCEDVLPAIMTTGTYSKEAPVVKPHQQETSMNNDILSLGRVVAEATAPATMKAVMEVSGMNVVAQKPVTTAFPAAIENTQPDNEHEYSPVHKVSWATGLSDATCRRLVTFSGIPSRHVEGVRGMCVHQVAFMEAAQALINESTPPAGKRKRWQHPEFGGFELRLKSENQQEAK